MKDKWFPVARALVMLTLLIGALMHLTRLIYGTDWFIANVYTPLGDSLFAVPMTLGAFAIIAARREYALRNRLEKAVVIFTGVYFTASFPLHVQTWLTQNTNYIRVFPMWFSAVFLVYSSFLQYVWWNLKSKASRQINKEAV